MRRGKRMQINIFWAIKKLSFFVIFVILGSKFFYFVMLFL